MPWVSRLLRGDRVWARALTSGPLITGADGRVDILYKPGGKVYRASARNLSDDPEPQTLPELPIPDLESPVSTAAVATVATVNGPGDEGAAQHTPATDNGAAKPKRAVAKSGLVSKPGHVSGHTKDAANPIIVYADGACTGNPGPCGLGVVILDGTSRRELSEYLGIGTNNIGELMAIVRALEESPRDRTVIVHSDSAYALGLLGKNWKPKANQELVARMKKLGAEFKDLRLVKVAGHSGIVENERADELARDAVTRRR